MDIKVIGGFCPGVERAYRMVLNLQEKNPDKQVVLLGELVHNQDVLDSLVLEGIKTVDTIDDLANFQTDKPIYPVIRAHGTTLQEEKRLAVLYGNNGYFDLTCTFVKKGPQQAAAEFSKQGYRVVIFGKPGHPEVMGIASRAKQGYVVIEKVDEVPDYFKENETIGLVAQTTTEFAKYGLLADNLRLKGLDVLYADTYCNATKQNQTGIKDIAEWADLVVVVGGINSSNTKKLYDICSRDVITYKIENSDGLQPEWFKDKPNNIGIAAGASTPSWAIDDVKATIERYYV